MIDSIPSYLPPCPEAHELDRLTDGWGLSLRLACKLLAWRQWLHDFGPPLTVLVISGGRTASDQEELRRRGRPAADPYLSTHVEKEPGAGSTGVDIQIYPEDRLAWWWVGIAAEANGLRWGGGSALDSNGHPTDRNHLDLGRKWA